MRSVIAFVGSARKQGVTHRATRQFLDALQSFGDVRSELVFLSEYDIGLCRGCKACFIRGEEFCPLHDDRDVLIEKMMRSDGVVLASPVYSFQVSAHMKAFLDRLGFAFHRPRFHGKAYTSIVVEGMGLFGGSDVVKYLDFVGIGLGFNVVKGSRIVCRKNPNTANEPLLDEERRKMDEALARQSRRFHEKLSGHPFPEPTMLQLLGFRMARTSIRLELGPDSPDHAYYRDHGWFGSDYFYPTRLGVLKEGRRSHIRPDRGSQLEEQGHRSRPRTVGEGSMRLSSIAATSEERCRKFPGDGLLNEAIGAWTHAVTIGARPQTVWPWLVQMGAGRAGWYSWDVVDNDGQRSAEELVPGLQRISLGDVLPAVPGAADAFVVERLEPGRDLVLAVPHEGGGLRGTWEFLLDPLPGERTRLLVRARVGSRGWRTPLSTVTRPIEFIYWLLARMPRRLMLGLGGAGHRVMQARQLRGIRRRSEAQSPPTGASTPEHDVVERA